MKQRKGYRPRPDMKEWDECLAASRPQDRSAYAKWCALWHVDSMCSFGELLKETRKVGYDGELP